jgi:uncharacterized protein (DUF362 family)
MNLSRRDLLRSSAGVGVLASLPQPLGAAEPRAQVVVVRERDRARAVAACLEATGFTEARGKAVAIKANFNSADPFPASTHPATLTALLSALKAGGATRLTLGERSGMGETRRVLQATGAADVLAGAGAHLVVLDESPAEDWRHFQAEHWPRGFHGARLFSEAPCAVQTMCCKTHRFGGHVTLSLKNAVGLVAKRVPGVAHDFMQDLHSSAYQRAMIAEANLAWRPALSVMDCLEAFVDGGPERGTRVAPGIFLASADRCALDAAAIALLRFNGMGGPAARGSIGATDQLARAIELGLGAPPRSVKVVPVTPAAREIAARLGDLLYGG